MHAQVDIEKVEQVASVKVHVELPSGEIVSFRTTHGALPRTVYYLGSTPSTRCTAESIHRACVAQVSFRLKKRKLGGSLEDLCKLVMQVSKVMLWML